jgi:molecular chaperone HtpG
MSQLHATQVDLSGLMRVLGEALYSTPSVAVRELVQNAHDSITRRNLECPEVAFEPRIIVRVDAKEGVLDVIDTGAGLTEDEIKTHLATVGRGYTRTLRDQGQSDGLIGYFGLGFLSAFVVASRVEVRTTSYQDPSRTLRFLSRNGETYSITEAEPQPVGTLVRLHLRDEHKDLAQAPRVTALLDRFAPLLHIPLEGPGGTLVNAVEAPWRAGISSIESKRNALAFAARFDFGAEPLAVFPFESKSARGIVWIRGGGSYATSDLRRISVFVRGMFIGDEDRELLPSWAGFAGAIVESDVLKPTASRETVQRDATYDEVANDLREALVQGLADAAAKDRATFRRILLRHNEALLGAAVDDPRLFALLADEATLPTTEGDLTADRILERSRGVFHISRDERGGFEQVLFRAQRTPVLLGTRFAVEVFAKAYCERRRGRVEVLGTRDDTSLFRPAQLAPAEQELLQNTFAQEDHEVFLRAFEPATLPFIVVADREAELKRRIEADEADKRISRGVLALARNFTSKIQRHAVKRLYVNVESPLIQSLLRAKPEARARALRILRPMLVLLSHSDVEVDIEPALRELAEALITMLEV